MSILNKHRIPFCGPSWNQRCQGFTLVELVVVMGVYSHFINKAKNTRAIAEIRLLEKEILEFWQTNDRLPDSLAELGHAAMLDPWKTPYQYINFGTTAGWEDIRRVAKKKDNGKGKSKGKGNSAALNEDFDLFSLGEDRMSAPDLDDGSSLDDIVRADDGRYTGLASEYKS